MKIEKARRGFTIVEVVIVIAVVAIMATVLVPTFGDVIQNAKDSAAKQEAKNTYTSYMVEHAGRGEMPELFLYKAEESRVVALQNGAAVGVYESEDAALTDLIGEDDDINELKKVTADGKLFAYGGEMPENGEPTGPQKEPLAGKKISFMGDSISTFEGWSNNGTYNSTLADNRVMYNKKGDSKYQNLLSVDETWWMRTVNKLGLELCVNNSYSGSRVTSGGSYPSETGCGDRAINLHNDNTGEMPDIIVIFMGTNDYQQIGSSVSVDAFARDYAVMVEKIKNTYPDADVYLCTLPNYDHVTAQKSVAPTAYNEKIEWIAESYGCNLVDFYNETGVTPDNLKYYTVDLLIDRNDISLVHPNASGMAKMYECLKAVLAQNYKLEETPKDSYAVTFEGNEAFEGPSVVTEGDVFEVKLTNALNVTVTMSGNPIDCYDRSNGKIFIPYVTGNIVITVKLPEWMEYRNELPTEFDSATNLFKLEGIKLRVGFYNANNIWDPQRNDVISAIFAVSQGMQIQSSSFVHTDGTYKGTIITWFMQDGAMQTVKQEYVYEQQTTIGYVTVPEGVVAVSMVWRTTCAEETCKNNYMYITLPNQN